MQLRWKSWSTTKSPQCFATMQNREWNPNPYRSLMTENQDVDVAQWLRFR